MKQVYNHSLKNILILLAILTVNIARSEVKLPQLLSDNMILQRDTKIHLWGYADPQEKITIQFKGETKNTTADINGNWSVFLNPSSAGGPYTIVINDKTISNVLIGDVWLCSGQSNVDLPIYRVEDLYKNLTDTLHRSKVRLIKISNATNILSREEDVKNTYWRELAPDNVSDFSAISYFLANDLYEKTGIPQGVIACSWGGTPIQSWIGEEYIKKYPHYYSEMLMVQDDEYTAQVNRASQTAGRAWSKTLYKLDPGVHEKWYSEFIDESEWSNVYQFDNRKWTQSEKGPFSGSYWFRQHIKIDKKYAGSKATLRLGCLVDADSTYLNGVLVGTTGYQYPPRKYNIPEGLLKEGNNVITVRLIAGANAEFVKEKPYKIVFPDNSEIQLSEEWKFRQGAYMSPQNIQGINMQNRPTACYNAMLYPLHRFPVSGVLWYQGESNTGRAKEYEYLLGDLMDNWRRIWDNETLPFFIVQLPEFMPPTYTPSESGWVTLRESQRRATINDEHAELIVGLGLGEWNDIHPLRKKELAERVSLEIRNKVYNQDVIITPRLTGGTINGNKVVLSFSGDIYGNEDGEVYDFEISDDGKTYKNARALVKNNSIFIFSDEINRPVSVRYAWRNTPPAANLKSKNKLPLPTFQWDKP